MIKFFYLLPQQQRPILRGLPDCQFYTKDSSGIVPIHYSSAPVWCPYDYREDDSWTNPISYQVHKTHQLGLNEKDRSFFDGFYQITTIEGLTFGEGQAWDPDTNTKIDVEKTDQMSIWNPFFQRYDPPCDNNCRNCEPFRIKYDFVNESFHEIFKENMDVFTNVYCQCCICNGCHEIHTYDCVGNSIRTRDY